MTFRPALPRTAAAGSDAVDDQGRVGRRRNDGDARGRPGLHNSNTEREGSDRGVEVGRPGADGVGQERHQRRAPRPGGTP